MIEKLEIEAMYKENTLGRELFEMSQKINELIEAVNNLQQIVYDFTGHNNP